MSNRQQSRPILGSRVPADVGGAPSLQPVVLPSVDHIPALFTRRELDTLRGICRDSDNENASRFLRAALDRAASK